MKNVKEILAGRKRNVSHSDTNEHRHNHAHNEDNQKGARYQCPMKCEDEKTYEEPGVCPVCNMKLVPLKQTKHNHKNYGYDGHSYHRSSSKQ